MGHDNIEALATEVKDILLAERALLAVGRAKDVLTLGEEKGAAVRRFEEALRSSVARNMAAGLRRYIEEIVKIAKENEQHFLAVRNGLKGLIARLERIDDSVCAGVYSQHGQDVTFDRAVGSYLKKV